MDLSSHHGSFGESPFVFDQQVTYPFDLPTGDQTSNRDQLDLSPFEQSNGTSGNLDLAHLRHNHKADENSYLRSSNSPLPSNPSGGAGSSHSGHHHHQSGAVGAVDFLNNNSLGLLASLNPSPPSTTQGYSTSHSHSMMHANTLQRQASISNMSDTSGSSYYDGASVGSQSQLDPTSPTRSSFTPAQSPLGISHSLSSISGLAIGTPQHQSFDLNRDGQGFIGQRAEPFQGRNHEQLLSLAGPVQIMAPPPGKRRATGVAHTLYTNQLRQSRAEEGADESTPMPPSTQTFDGQQSQDVCYMTQQPHNPQHFYPSSTAPITPGRNSMGGVPVTYQPPHPHSGMGTPSDSIRSSISSSFSAPRLRRMDSYDSAYSSTLSSPVSEFGPSSAGLEKSTTFQPRLLEDAMAEQEARYGQYSQGGPSPVSSNNAATYGAGLSSSSMSRVSSAPGPSIASAASGGGSDVSSQSGFPGTPSRTSTFLHQVQQHSQQHHHDRRTSLSMAPQTPVSHQHQPSQYDLTFSAPQMMSSRSMGFMQSPAGVVSPMSVLDQGTPNSVMGDRVDMGQSPSSGVTRNQTPRRSRGSALPPLIVSSADKMHVCKCGKRFKRLEHLKRHDRVHTQERPHACPAPGCNKFFGRTDNLTQHLKTHYRAVGRSSQNLLSITSAKAASIGQEGSNRHSEARHDPHAAAAAAAAQAVSKTNQKARRSTVSNDVLGGPIALSRPASSSPNSNQGNQSFSRSPVALQSAPSPSSAWQQ